MDVMAVDIIIRPGIIPGLFVWPYLIQGRERMERIERV